MKKKKTHEEYVAEVETINPNIEVLDEYIDSRTPILHRCKIDGYQWKPSPNNILRGSGCPICRNRILREQRVKSQEQYEKDVLQIHPTIKIIGTYINAETPILHRCLLDGYEWMSKPGNILHGKGCPKCANNIKLTNNEYLERLKEINQNILPIEEYINAHTPILHKCLIDNYVWSVQPSSILQGYGCPKCAGNAKKTHDDYVKELADKNPMLEVLEQYAGANTPILHRCKIDNYEWKIPPSRALICETYPRCKESKGERSISQWLESHNIEYKYEYSFDNCRDKKPLPFDFYIPLLNICIEYDGLQHFEPVDFAGKGEKWALSHFEMVQYHDKIKTDYCKNNNIPLLHIPYFKNIKEELEKFLFI